MSGCGIVGYLNKSKSLDKETLIGAVKTLHHRGPEELNTWQSQDSTVGLGHARLCIIDLLGGHQPFHSQDGSITAVVNGEFYGYTEIREDLIKKGYKFKTHSDNEILVGLYQEYGPDCMSYLRGEFAFILWDSRKKIIFAARDRLGIKPLYYTRHNGGLYLASEIKALLKLGIPALWNEDAVVSMNQSLYRQDLSIFKDISPLKPGHFCIASESDIKFVKYWDLDYAKDKDLPTQYDEKEYIQAFRQKLEDAVKVRLKADVPVGCYLSGGIDSSAVLALATQIHHKPITAFTISFGNTSFDESKYARDMAKLTNADYYEVLVTQKDVVENLAETLYHTETPVINSDAVCLFLLSKAVHKHHYKVILTGGGADELMGGYVSFKEDLLNYESQDLTEAERQQFRKMIRESSIASSYFYAHRKIKVDPFIEEYLNYAPSQLKAHTQQGELMMELYSKQFQKRARNIHPIRNFLKSLDKSQLEGRSVINQSMYLYIKSNLAGYEFTLLSDRPEMAHSVEGRLPFSDHLLYEFGRTLPIRMKIKGINEKYILKEAVKDVITKEVYERVKQPFYGPPTISPTEPHLYKFMLEVFNGDALNKLPFFDKHKVLTLLKRLPEMDVMEMNASDNLLWSILSLCLLQDRFNIT